MPIRRQFLLLTIAASIALPACKKPAEAETSAAVSTIYLVRHAEKEKGDDPALTEAGIIRAEELKTKLKRKGVQYIHSSDYRRTVATAKPLADELNLEIQIYNPRDLHEITEEIKARPGVHLVVGHSNTTPQLASLISGQMMEEMPETEYDRFIEINLDKTGATTEFEVTSFGAVN